MAKEPSVEEKVEFIFKLARADNMPDSEAASAIAVNIRGLEAYRDFVSAFDMIDPDQAYSETKLLDNGARRRLSEGLNLYIESRRQDG